MRQIDHMLAGGVQSAAGRYADVLDPNNGGVQARVILGDRAILDRAVAAAKAAQPAWAATNPQRRARVMFEFKHLVENNMQALAEMLQDWPGTLLVAAHDETFLHSLGITGRLHASAQGWSRLPP